MNISQLEEIVRSGENAQEELNQIARHIYNTYLAEIKTQKAEVIKEFPSYEFEENQWSDLDGFPGHFHSYWIADGKISFKGADYFRGETNYEYDSLPESVFTDDPQERVKAIREIVKKKADAVRAQLKKEAEQREQQQRQQYEELKEKFESKP